MGKEQTALMQQVAERLLRLQGECWVELTTAEESGVVHVRGGPWQWGELSGVLRAALALNAWVQVHSSDPAA